MIDTNLTSAFICSQAAYPRDEAARRRQDHQHRLDDVDLRRLVRPGLRRSKGGVVQLTKALATAWAKDNIQVNAVLPGWIDTELTKQARERGVRPQQPGADAHAGQALGRSRRHAGVAVFLAAQGLRFRHRHRHPRRRRLFRTGVAPPATPSRSPRSSSRPSAIAPRAGTQGTRQQSIPHTPGIPCKSAVRRHGCHCHPGRSEAQSRDPEPKPVIMTVPGSGIFGFARFRDDGRETGWGQMASGRATMPRTLHLCHPSPYPLPRHSFSVMLCVMGGATPSWGVSSV